MIRFLTILLVLTAAVGNAATLDFSFTSSLLYSTGFPVTFNGTLTNTGTTTAYINGDNVTSALPFDDTPFLLGAPLFLNPGDSFTGSILTVSPGPGTPLGLYTGTFSVTGGDTPADTAILSSAVFAVQVVPEPATWISGLALIAVFLVRRAGFFPANKHH